MSIASLEAIATFKSSDYESEQLSNLSNGDWEGEDFFGEEPESIQVSNGGITHSGDLCLDDPDEYGYYVIDGDLNVDGVLHIDISDVYNVIVVKGDLKAKALVVQLHCQLYVTGTVTIDGPIVAYLADGGGCYFQGKTNAEAVLTIGSNEPFLKESSIQRPDAAFRQEYAEAEDPSACITAMVSDLSLGTSILA